MTSQHANLFEVGVPEASGALLGAFQPEAQSVDVCDASDRMHCGVQLLRRACGLHFTTSPSKIHENSYKSSYMYLNVSKCNLSFGPAIRMWSLKRDVATDLNAAGHTFGTSEARAGSPAWPRRRSRGRGRTL